MQDGIRRTAYGRKQCRKDDRTSIPCPSDLEKLMKPYGLKPLGDFKFLFRVRHFSIRKDDGLFFREVEYKAFAAHFRIPPEQTQTMIERYGKPSAVFVGVEV